MPWVYVLQLAELRGAGAIKKDWEDNIPGNANVMDEYGGVTVTGDGRCVIVSQQNNPEYEEMENLDHIRSISEHKEIPSDPEPQELGHGIWCQFDNSL